MKTLLILTALSALTLQAQTPAPVVAKVTPGHDTAPNPLALSAEHAAKWRQAAAAIEGAAAALKEAKVALLDAQEARQQAEATMRAVLNDSNAVAAKIQTEAKCLGCAPVEQPDGSLVWKKPAQ